MKKRQIVPQPDHMPKVEPVPYIDSGYSHPFIVHAGREFDPIATYQTLTEARGAYPNATVTTAAIEREVKFIKEIAGE